MGSFFRFVPSPVGVLKLETDGEGITGVVFAGKDNTATPPPQKPEIPAEAAALLDKTEKQLGEYFKKTRKTFSVPLKPAGTEFQKAILHAMAEIPYGKTVTYARLAADAGRPKATRAAGNACGANPIPILIPCHRVVATHGEGGFSGGIDIKRFLLALETQT